MAVEVFQENRELILEKVVLNKDKRFSIRIFDEIKHVRGVESSCSCQKDRHRELQSDPVFLILAKIDEINISKLVIGFRASKSYGLIVSFIAPEDVREIDIESFLHGLILISSEPPMILFGKWWVHNFDKNE